MGVFDENGSGNNGPENVADSRSSACRTPTDSEELSKFYALPSALTGGLNSRGYSNGVRDGVMARQ